MAENNTTNNNSTSGSNNNNNSNNNQQQQTGGGGKVVLGCDTNGSNDSACQETVAKILEGGGYQVQKLAIGPNEFATASYQDSSSKGVYLMADSIFSIADFAFGSTPMPFAVFGIRGDLGLPKMSTEEDFQNNPLSADSDCTSICDRIAGKTYPQINQETQGKCVAVFGKTCEELGQKILAALGGGTGGTMSESGAQIKDKTFENCIRRICAATDSIFLVENNAAILFPYTDWMAITLKAKIQTIKAEQIDPDIFEIEYNTEGFYNKVTGWYGDIEVPPRYSKDGKTGKTIVNPTNVAKIKDTDSNITDTKNNITTKKSNTESGSGQMSKQYDPLVEIYGELEKRVTIPYPDEETTNFVLNALLIQYIRDFNNKCRLRTLSQKKYIGGTFYIVENPFTGKEDMFYLNGYTIRTQKDEPLYVDLDFRYGPEGAEELLDYQVYGGGGGGGQIDTSGEAQIWTEAAKIPYGSSFSSQDPNEAYNHLHGHEGDSAYSTECYGMSAYLYYRFNNQANIPCQVVGNSEHHVVMLDRGSGFQETRDEYRNYNFDYYFKWREDQDTTVLLAAPGKGGNTTSTNTSTGGNTTTK